MKRICVVFISTFFSVIAFSQQKENNEDVVKTKNVSTTTVWFETKKDYFNRMSSSNHDSFVSTRYYAKNKYTRPKYFNLFPRGKFIKMT